MSRKTSQAFNCVWKGRGIFRMEDGRSSRMAPCRLCRKLYHWASARYVRVCFSASEQETAGLLQQLVTDHL